MIALLLLFGLELLGDSLNDSEKRFLFEQAEALAQLMRVQGLRDFFLHTVDCNYYNNNFSQLYRSRLVFKSLCVT